MKVNWNYIKGLLLLGTLTFLVGFTHEKNSAKNVNDITIKFDEGNSLFMDYQMVNKLLIQNGNSLKNKPKSVLDLYNLELNILSHPMVESASVYLTIDGVLKTRIKQRTPIARVIAGSESYYIDKQAKRMPLSKNHSARVMLIYGYISEKDSEEIHLLVSKIGKNEFLKKQIISARKKANGEFDLKVRIGEQIVYLGTLDNLDSKLKNLASFFSKTMSDKSIENYTSINLKYNNQVVCAKK